MLYRRLGKTEIEIPVFTCGGLRFQHSMNKADTPPVESIRNVESVVQRCLELGINQFDTANGYGTSETELGIIFKNIPRDKFHIQTKAPLRKDTSEFVRLFNESLNSLQLDYVDLFALHGINNDELLDFALKKGGCFEAALKLKEEGRIKHIGFSTHGTTDMIVKTIQQGHFDFVFLHWFFINQDNTDAILAAHKKDMGVLILSPSDKGGMLYKPSEKIKQLTAPLSPMAFNDLFCLSRPEISTLTLGAARPSDLDEHVNALELYDKRNEIIPPIAKKLTDEYNKILGKDWAETWKQGLPAWNETPGNINIPVILYIWNTVKAYDLIDFGKMRFNLMGNGGHWFPGNRPDNIDTHDFTSCLKDSPNADKIPGILKEAYDTLAGKEVKRLGTH